MLFEIILAIWGCMAELDPSCTREVFDMTNAASTWVGLVAGVGIGAIITWWIYYRQKKISVTQDKMLKNMDNILELIKSHQLKNEDHQNKVLDQILSLNERIDSILDKK
jgi:type II secretory pathway component PulF